eukprot:TRINITY_DN5526_c0_g1_i1.p1 TRINITY_DN5526_c0_g1~~TRINITY_DN5526_c0_g1_i1.p1  ORF type:complete len:117 (-),score=7.13 TRINITY_DN5526_c0_g1_i1:68-418(-)
MKLAAQIDRLLLSNTPHADVENSCQRIISEDDTPNEITFETFRGFPKVGHSSTNCNVSPPTSPRPLLHSTSADNRTTTTTTTSTHHTPTKRFNTHSTPTADAMETEDTCTMCSQDR